MQEGFNQNHLKEHLQHNQTSPLPTLSKGVLSEYGKSCACKDFGLSRFSQGLSKFLEIDVLSFTLKGEGGRGTWGTEAGFFWYLANCAKIPF